MNVVIQSNSGGYHFIAIPKEMATPFLENNVKRVLCLIQGVGEVIKVHSAFTYTKQAGHVIMLGKRVLKQIEAKAGDTIEVELREDTSPDQFEGSEVLNEVLESDPTAKTAWESLTAGRRRRLTYLVLQVKSIDKRIERSLKIADKIKLGMTDPRKILK